MLNAATIILGLSVLLTLVVLRTPTFRNSKAAMIIVIDTLTFEILGLCILLAFHNHDPQPLQFGLLVAMLGFLSTIVLARFIDPPSS
jgi:multisubunit Na+/H+ antiporter MnhF subunit